MWRPVARAVLLAGGLLLVSVQGFTLGSSCVNRCGSGANAWDYSCQCNSLCESFGDCCDDYPSVCLGSAQPSCKGRCGSNLDRALGCQCNDHCIKYGDCCHDYQTECNDSPEVIVPTTPTATSGPGTCLSWSKIGQALWDSDVNRLTGSDVTIDYQSQIPDRSSIDQASNRLFKRVDESKLSAPTFKAYLALLDNYDPVKGQAETETDQERTEVDTFLDAVLDTKVMAVLLNFLKCQGLSSAATRQGLKTTLHRLWFETYKRSPTALHRDTSGFEHMIGEYKTSSLVNGFHSWLSFYAKEKEGNLDYMGYVSKKEPSILGSAFRWDGRLKSKGTFFTGVSPEFDLATYSLCYLYHKNQSCTLTINGRSVVIKTYDSSGHVATAFVV